jgi:hypothetical protein
MNGLRLLREWHPALFSQGADGPALSMLPRTGGMFKQLSHQQIRGAGSDTLAGEVHFPATAVFLRVTFRPAHRLTSSARMVG